MFSNDTSRNHNQILLKKVNSLIVKMIRDLEDTREKYSGFSYVRTMRNILTGKEDAAIAPFFKDKSYYGIFSELSLEELENHLDSLVNDNQIDVIYTNHGKLYCTHEYYVHS